MSDVAPATPIDVLACPSCLGALAASESGLRCAACAIEYPQDSLDRLDIRLRQPKIYTLQHSIHPAMESQPEWPLELRRPRADPEVDYRGWKIPPRFEAGLLTHIPRARDPGRYVLDLGCGDAVHRPILEHAGFKYIGIDYGDPQSPLIADAQAIPLRSEVCDFVLSISMLQYVPDPTVVLREIYRVTKPGGRVLGTAAFLEPYNNTYFHFSYKGLGVLLNGAGFTIERLMVHPHWTVLRAQLGLGLFPYMPQFLGRMITAPLDLLHRAWWQVGRLVDSRASTLNRVATTTGSIAFVALKPKKPH